MRRCLVIDDSPIIRKVARLVLERLRYEVDEAETVPGALEKCEAVMPDAILLDWHLPGATAYEFLTGLRNMGRSSKPYIVYCTTENDPIDINRAFIAGCDDYMTKPFTRQDLEAKFAAVPNLAA